MSSFELDEESNDDLEANISFNIIRKEFFDNNEISELYGKELINFKPDNIIEWRNEMEEKDKVKIVPKMNLGLLFKINQILTKIVLVQNLCSHIKIIFLMMR